MQPIQQLIPNDSNVNSNNQNDWTTTMLHPWWNLPARTWLVGNYNTAWSLQMPEVANYIKWLVSDLSSRDKQNQWIYDLYSSFWNNLYGMMNDRNSVYWSMNQDMLWKLAELMKQYNSTYWPTGEMTNRVNELYGNYGNYLVNKWAQDRMYSSWISDRYGLSDNAKTIAGNDVWLQSLSEALKIFDAQTQALDNINKTFNTLNADAFSKYGWIQNDYVKSLADQNFWVQTQLSQWLLNLLANNEQMKKQMQMQKQYASKSSTPASATVPTQQPAASTPASATANPQTYMWLASIPTSQWPWVLVKTPTWTKVIKQ